ncbi:MAG TPA: YciI family protein [Woeseiaceae bacterium]
MRYMLFCCIDENHWDGLSQQERDDVMADYGAWVDGLEASGRHIMSARLQPVANAATVRSNGARFRVLDGPFAETKEQIGGFHLVEAESREDALALAQGIPTLRVGGTIEVRALRPEYA